MKIVILCAVILLAATAGAQTTIIEYPDHFYVESTGVPDGKTVAVRENSAPPAVALSASADQNGAQPAAARPATNFGNTPQPVDPAERRAALDKTLQRLQREQSELMTPKEGETSGQIVSRQQEASGKLRKINKLMSELQNIPAQSIELNK